MLKGRVLDEDAQAVSGADVLIGAYPHVSVIESIPEGRTFAVTPIAQATTDADGHFTVRVANRGVLKNIHDDIGVDLEINVVRDGALFTTGHQVTFVDSLNAWASTELLELGTLEPGAEPPTGRVQRALLEAEPIEIVLDPAATIQFESISSHSPDDPAPRHHHLLGGGCTDYKVVDSRVVPQVVATTITRNGVRARVTYTSDAKTSSSRGFAVSGNGGNWSGVSYSHSSFLERQSQFTAGFTTDKAPLGTLREREFRMGWRHSNSERHCSTDSSNLSKWQAQRLTKPVRAVDVRGHFTSTYDNFGCTPRAAQATYVETYNQTAWRYGSAFTIGTSPSYKGSSRSGYSSGVRIRYEFNDGPSGTRAWCGIGDVDPPVAKRIKAWIMS